ncbi:MAG: hypothetical protein KF856_18025 [Cyclobacteriaceae bacterium]|nr:hypothetical protein [Cyclobacteriaceae bacterium]
MIIVVDTNIVFSAILDPQSNFAETLLKPKSKNRFYSTTSLILEIDRHKAKIKKLAGYSEEEFQFLYRQITSKIKFYNPNLIPSEILSYAHNLCHDIDLEDTEFVALTEHIRGNLWSGDKKLKKGLANKGWSKFVSLKELLP